MWTTLSAGRWIFIFSLLVVMNFSTSKVNSFNPVVGNCCFRVANVTVRDIKACYEQLENKTCRLHAFQIERKNGKIACIDPKFIRIGKMIRKAKHCEGF